MPQALPSVLIVMGDPRFAPADMDACAVGFFQAGCMLSRSSRHDGAGPASASPSRAFEAEGPPPP